MLVALIHNRVHPGTDFRIVAGRVALHIALENRWEDAALLLIEHGANISARYVARSDALRVKFEDGRTPIIWAAHHGLDRVVRKLIELGADVDAQK